MDYKIFILKDGILKELTKLDITLEDNDHFRTLSPMQDFIFNNNCFFSLEDAKKFIQVEYENYNYALKDKTLVYLPCDYFERIY